MLAKNTFPLAPFDAELMHDELDHFQSFLDEEIDFVYDHEEPILLDEYFPEQYDRFGGQINFVDNLLTLFDLDTVEELKDRVQHLDKDFEIQHRFNVGFRYELRKIEDRKLAMDKQFKLDNPSAKYKDWTSNK